MNSRIKAFSGEFIKHKKYVVYDELIKNGYTVIFNDLLYKQISDDIKKIVGDKKRYYVEDAVYYFQTKYQAYRIPWEYSSWYEDPNFDIEYTSQSHLDPDSMRPFDYSELSDENNITLVIDTVFNKSLRQKYIEIEKLEKQLSSRSHNLSKTLHRCNPIIVIGYKKSRVINSMFMANNFNLLDDSENLCPNIPDIPYEMWFFYKHSSHI